MMSGDTTYPSEKGTFSYSPDEKIWRPINGQGQEAKRIPSETFRSGIKGPLGLSASDLTLLRDNFKLSTWLLVGACLQGAVVAFSPSVLYALLPACVIISWRIIHVVLQCFGIFKNPNMADVILGKFSVHSPDQEGRLVGEPAQQGSLIVLLLNIRCNHPLGMFAPGFKDIADQFDDMIKELEKEPEKYGFHTSTAWIGRGGDRTTSQEIMTVFYFKSLDKLHQFAHTPVHRVSWEYWNRNIAKLDHISTSHEIYETKEVEAAETIYVNYHRAGYSSQNVKLEDGSYVVPLVDASEGQYRTSKGRLNKVDHGKSNDRYYEKPYQHARLFCPALNH